MRVLRRAGSWLAALALVGVFSGARAAVMTTDVGLSGCGPFDLKYVLATNVDTLKIDVIRATDDAVVRTLDSAVSGTFDAADLQKGKHVLAGKFDGKDNGGAMLPLGSYYLRCTTDAAAQTTAMTLLAGPTPFAPQTGRTEARNVYGGGAIRTPDSPYHNLAYFGVCHQGNTAGSAGTDVVSADGTSVCFANGNIANLYDYLESGVTSDGYPVVGSQSTNTLKLINPADGSVLSEYSLGVLPRSLACAGSSTSGKIFFLDGSNGGVKSWDLAGGMVVDEIPDSPNFSFYETAPGTPGCTTPQRGLTVSADGNTVWVSGTATSTTAAACLPSGVTSVVLPGFVAKYARSGGSWTRTDFTASIPGFNRLLTSNNLRGLALSPDESILWVSVNNASTSSTRYFNNYVIGLDAQTGLPKGAEYTYNFFTATPTVTVSGTPQGLAVTSTGNIYVACWNAAITGTSAAYVAVLAPPDGGNTTDVSRSATFVINGGPINAVNAPFSTVNNYHEASVQWDTDIDSTSSISYGTAPGSLTKTVTSAALTKSHVVLLQDLDQNKTYYYQVKSTAVGYCPSYTSPVLSFDIPALSVGNVVISDVTTTNATIAWDSGFDTSLGQVDLGTTAGTYPVSLADPQAAVAAHKVVFTGLKPNTTYHVVADSFWLTTLTHTLSSDQTFTTLGFVNITKETLSANTTSATLNYTTDVASSGTVKYGAGADPTTWTLSIPVASGTSHTVTFPGLAAGATYYYTIDLSAPTADTRTTKPSAFTTPLASAPAASVTDDTPDKFMAAQRTQITVGAAGSLLSIDKQMLPGKPVKGPDLPSVVTYGGWTLCNGYLYSIAGTPGPAIANGVATVNFAKIQADGSIGAWAATAAIPSPRVLVTSQCTSYNGTIYVVSGDDLTGAIVPTVFYAKPNADGTVTSWQTGPTLPDGGERDIASVVISDGYLLVSGGEPNTAGVLSVTSNEIAPILADGSLGAWHETTPLAVSKYVHRSVVNDHTVYSLGGVDNTTGQNVMKSTETIFVNPNGDLGTAYRNNYDPAHADALMDAGHYGMATAMIGGKIFTVGGRLDTTVGTNLISHTRIAADGLTTKWAVDAAQGTTNAYVGNLNDNEGIPYNGTIYCGPGRNGGGYGNGQAFTGYVPMVVDAAGGYAFAGSLESRFIDLGAVSNLSHITVTGAGLTDSNVEVRYRYAGTDGYFSDWFTAGLDTDISGGARYVQYQLVLKGDGTATPVVNSVVVNAGTVSMPGDINKDGVVNGDDVKMALRIAAGLLNANDASVSFTNGNVVATDSVIDLKDATAIQRKINRN